MESAFTVTWAKELAPFLKRPNGEENQMQMNASNTVYIYEVAAIERPTLIEEQNGATAKVVLAPTAVVANGRSSAIAAAVAKIPSSMTYEPQRTTFIVRKFVGDNC